MRRLLTLALACALLSLTPTIEVATARTNVYVVDDDGAQCGNADFATIGAAVAAAAAGDRVRVCPGTYAERVLVDKPLTIQGRPDGVAGLPCENTTDVDAAVVPVLGPPDATEAPVLRIAADDVEVSGLVVQGVRDDTPTVVAPGYSVVEPAVQTDEAHAGWRIHHNLFRDNTLALELGSDGSAAGRVDHNCFRDNSYAGANQRLPLSRARLDHNATLGSGVVAWEVGWGHRAASDIRLDHNTSRSDARFTQVENAADVRVETNTVIAPGILGVQVRRGSSDVAVEGNQVTGALTGSAFSLGSQTAGTAPLPPASGVTLTDNVGTGNAQSGVVATPGADVSGALIAGNVLSGNTNGMLLAGGTRDNVIRDNVAEANRAFGIRLLAGTSGNLLKDNILTGSGTADARDDSDVVADGVTLLLNTWTGTTCDSDFPDRSIC